MLANHRATLLQGPPRFVGTGPQIAEQMEQWFRSRSCDGFVIAATHFPPGAFEDFVRLVVPPELRSRGLVRENYTGTTLRENLGLERPENIFGAGHDAPVATGEKVAQHA